MKKFCIILLNIFIIVILLVIADYGFFTFEKTKYIKFSSSSECVFDKNQVVHFAKNVYHSANPIEENRSFITKSDKSVLLLGCSYTYGSNLEPNQSFSYYLSSITGQTVYNLGIPGGGVQDALYMTSQDDFAKKYPNVELAIYTFIDDHLNRNNEFIKCSIFAPYCNFRMVKQGDKYVKANEWYAFPSRIFLFRYLLEGVSFIKNSKIFYKKNCKSFADMLNLTNRNLKKMYPNSKFVFLCYQYDKSSDWFKYFDKDIIVISTYDIKEIDLERPEYQHGGDPHPTEKVWQDLVPLLVEKLKTQKCL